MIISIKRGLLPFIVAKCLKSLPVRLQFDLSNKYQIDTDNERIISVDILPNDLIIIFNSTDSLPEGVAKERNAVLNNLLLEQLSPLLGQQDPEALKVFSLINQIKEINENKALAIEEEGANLLLIA